MTLQANIRTFSQRRNNLLTEIAKKANELGLLRGTRAYEDIVKPLRRRGPK